MLYRVYGCKYKHDFFFYFTVHFAKVVTPLKWQTQSICDSVCVIYLFIFSPLRKSSRNKPDSSGKRRLSGALHTCFVFPLQFIDERLLPFSLCSFHWCGSDLLFRSHLQLMLLEELFWLLWFLLDVVGWSHAFSARIVWTKFFNRSLFQNSL